MDYDKLKEIAAHSGTSISTVRRVLSHCAGITAETRATVIQSQCALSHSAKSIPHRLFFVLPDNPKAFWHQTLTVLNAYPFDPPVKLSFYPSLHQQTVLTEYLQPLLEERDAVLVLSATLTAEQRELVSKIAEHNLVIQLCERSVVENTVYIGGDPYEEGFAVGTWASTRAKRVAIVHRAGNHNVSERIRGFTDAVGDVVSIVTIPEPEECSLYASLLARKLHTLSPVPDLLVCPSGFATEVCGAAYKLRDTAPMQCITWEEPTQNERTAPLLAAAVKQALADQTRTALQLATDFLQNGKAPQQTEYHIPSRITYYK